MTDITHVHYLERNDPIYRVASNHPGAVFDEIYFIHLLENSLALTYSEKKEVIDAIHRLSQYQIDELVKVFLDEREQFKAIMEEESESIIKLYEEAKKNWILIIEHYETEEQKNIQQEVDHGKLDEIRKALM